MPSAAIAPPSFPPEVKYLKTPAPSRLLPPHLRLIYCSPCPPHLEPNPPPKLQIRKITATTHPACGQSGLFNATGKKIERGVWLRDYTGVVHLESETDPKSDYDLSLGRVKIATTPTTKSTNSRDEPEVKEEEHIIGIDATYQGGEARFVNDYRGTGLPRPNAVFELREWELPKGGGKGVRMAIFAGPQGVEKASEICVSYGKGFWDHRKREAQGG